MDKSHLWIATTLVASAGQVARNVMQRRLTDRIGVAAATQVRFLYGLPFAALFLPLVLLATGERLPVPTSAFGPFLFLGALTQVGATAFMLAAMRSRSFTVVTALVKTEPVQVAVFGFAVLGDRLPPLAVAAILIATAGVTAISWTPKLADDIADETAGGKGRAVLLGLLSAACFALSAVGFRGAILSLDGGGFLPRATATLVAGLALQSAILAVWSAFFDRAGLLGSLREWRSSFLAGFVGAAASQFWFIGFALTATANVRTLALIEIVFAQVVSGRVLRQRQNPRELTGTVLIVAGVIGLLVSAG